MTDNPRQPDRTDTTGETDRTTSIGEQPEAVTPDAFAVLPPGARLLTADEAIALIVTGDHPEAEHGSLPFDAAVIDALRSGALVACQLADDRLAFTRAEPPPL